MYATFLLVSCQKKELLSSDKKIVSFALPNLPTAKIVLDDTKQTISITFPYNSLIEAIAPKITISEGAMVVPASGQTLNFAQPVFFTLTAADGSKIIYTVVVKTQAQPLPILSKLSADSVEAGKEIILTAKNLGNFPLDITIQLVNAKNESFPAAFSYIDSTQLRLKTPIDIAPDRYNINLKVKTQQTISSQSLVISYPSPQLIQLQKRNILQGDTVWVTGKYNDATKYQFKLLLTNGSTKTELPYLLTKANTMGFKTSTQLSENPYQVYLWNKTENKKSIESGFNLQVYDASKPFVSGIINPQANYSKGSKVFFKTLNINQNTARFIQFSLINKNQSYYQNGIFDAKTTQLQLDLPANISAGTYSLNVSLINSSGSIFQSIDLDNELIIK